MTIADWLDCVKRGSFIDYDGMGSWATETHVLKREWAEDNYVYPSQVSKPGFTPPTWATHVMWFNR